MKAARNRFWASGLVAMIFLASGCSVYMEATRPVPVDLSKFKEGSSRDFVIENLGLPKGSITESKAEECDFYRLYTKGLGSWGKAGVAFFEGSADVVTAGLAEVLFTPAQIVTKDKEHEVEFCYEKQKLVLINDDAHCIEGDCGETVTSEPSQQKVTSAAVPGAEQVAAQPVLAHASLTSATSGESSSSTPAETTTSASPNATPTPLGSQQ